MKLGTRIVVVVLVMGIALFASPVFEDTGRAGAEVGGGGMDCRGSCQTCIPHNRGEICGSSQGSGACACNQTLIMGNPLYPESSLSGYGCYGVIVS